MKYFKDFKLFEADDVEKKEAPVEKKEDATSNTATPAPAYEEKFTFRNTFNYNKTEINDSFDKTMQEAIAKLDEFMKTENKDNIVKVVQINANGFASWVPTKYKSTTYELKNNINLANDRAKSIADEVKKRIQEYFKNKGIKDIDYKESEIKGSIDQKNSKEVFTKFIKDNYNAKSLVAELKSKGATEIKFVKDAAKVENPVQYMNVEDYATKFPDNIEKIKVDDANADKIFNKMLETPLYVLYTSHLGKDKNNIEKVYRESTQYAIVEIIINDPDLLIPPPKEDVKIDLKSVSFEKDVDVVDTAGKEAINKLVAYLQKTPANKIGNFILIGHAEADDELNKTVFDPKNDAVLKDKNGKETIMSEAQLANLRFVLSIARCKTVYRAIQNLETVKNLIEKKAFWMLPAGTLFGDKLATQGSTDAKQRVVQIVVLSDGKEINTEASAVPYGISFQSATLKEINKNVSTLGYTFSKLVPKLLGAQSFGTPVPNHLELAKDPNKLAHFKSQYV